MFFSKFTGQKLLINPKPRQFQNSKSLLQFWSSESESQAQTLDSTAEQGGKVQNYILWVFRFGELHSIQEWCETNALGTLIMPQISNEVCA